MSNRKPPPKGHKPGVLTALQRRACHEVMVDGDQTDAWRRASGKDSPHANHLAWRMFKLPHVAAYRQKLQDEQFKRLQMSADETLARTSQLARADLTQAYNADRTVKPFAEWPPELRAALVAFEVSESGIKIKIHDKVGPLNLMAKKHALLTEKIDAKNTVAISVVDPYAKPKDDE